MLDPSSDPVFSVIIPVYNRPDEVDELLESLLRQTYKSFEVLLIEDGSTTRCDHLVEKFGDALTIHYYFKENGGQGFARNFGYERANGQYFVVFDSDCLIPPHYFETVFKHLSETYWDAYGGPDAAHGSFTTLQKAINYSMTSFFTTGGIRGRKKRIGGAFHPRSFNMGISRALFEKTKGYRLPYMGEDLEFSIRIIEEGFSTGLIPEAFVYHKRRTSIRHFYKQLKFFGKARINVSRYWPNQIKLVHLFPFGFFLGVVVMLTSIFVYLPLFNMGVAFMSIYFFLIFIEALFRTKSPGVAFTAILTSFIQLFAYGHGFLVEGLKKLFSRKKSSEDYTSLYK